MRAMVYDDFQQRPEIREVPPTTCPPHGAVVRVQATGLCRSDWHGWMGHDPDITPPHVPGHELAGVIDELGPDVTGWSVGERVTTPFVNACGRCALCLTGNQQVCENQTQPGFTHWGSFAELVVVDHADVNLVRVPDEVDAATAASLGCRFATAYRAVVDHGGIVGHRNAGHGDTTDGATADVHHGNAGHGDTTNGTTADIHHDNSDHRNAQDQADGGSTVDSTSGDPHDGDASHRNFEGKADVGGPGLPGRAAWVAVHGCGGVGLSAVMIAAAHGANVVAVDISKEALDLARSLGAAAIVDGSTTDVPAAVHDMTGDGAHVSIDALGSTTTFQNSVRCLRRRGRHVQVGLLTGDHATQPVAMGPIISQELELVGSHGLAAHAYPRMMAEIAAGRLHPERLLGTEITLEDSVEALMAMSHASPTGITIIRP